MDTINILSLVAGVLGLCYAIYNTRQFAKGVKISSLRSIRTLINRMEAEKHKLQEDSPERTVMDLTQQDLDTLFKNLQKMFDLPDKDVPLT
jgi:hypothetical protein